MTRGIYHYATKADLEAVIRAVESTRELKYIKSDFPESPGYEVYESLLDYPMLGIAEGDQYIACAMIQVFLRDDKIVQRAVPQRRGGTRYKIDGQVSPSRVIIRLGGIDGEGVLYHGETMADSSDKVGIELFNAFARQIRKRFRKVYEFWVGKEAEELYRKGWRLTQAKHRSVDYDLKFPD